MDALFELHLAIKGLYALRGEEFYENSMAMKIETSETRELKELETKFRKTFREEMAKAWEAKEKADKDHKKTLEKAALSNE